MAYASKMRIANAMRRITASARAAPRNFTWDGAYRRRLLAISALCLSLYVAIVPSSTTASLGQWNTAHYAQVGAAILFWPRGFDARRERRRRPERLRVRRARVTLGGAAVLLGLAAVALVLVAPYLRQF